MTFELLLFSITIATGLVYLCDKLFWAKHRVNNDETVTANFLVRFSRDFFWVFFIVLLIRSFIVSPFYVPTGSLEPTIVPTELLLVDHFSYGLRMPVWGTQLLATGIPKRGQIIVFHWPVNPNVDLIKRVIGLPGDKISYVNKVLYINGKEATQKLLGYTLETGGMGEPVKKIQENLLGVKHDIYVCVSENNCPNPNVVNFYNLVVPKNEYFMMGDNRDDSDDSRDWGFVPAKDLVGKGLIIFMSWDNIKHDIRWHRIGTLL